MSRSMTMMAAAMLLTACGGSERAADNAASNFVPPKIQPATPMPGQTPSTPLSAYVGKYPHDAVEGVMFYDRTDVATALNEALGNAPIRVHFRERAAGPETPIFARGSKIGAWACEAHNCGDHNWTVLVDPRADAGEACYHDAATMGETSHWYADGRVTTRKGDCPSS